MGQLKAYRPAKGYEFTKVVGLFKAFSIATLANQ
jgi:hypothetical protein